MLSGPSSNWHLGIDYGTSNTVAVLQSADGRARPLIFDGSPLLGSAVCLDADGRLLVGADAEYGLRLDPTRYEPNPKRRIDEGAILLGDRPVPVVEAIAATIARVTAEATRTVGGALPSVSLTHPASWGAPRRELLVQAAHLGGVPAPTLVPEPVAAAMYFVSVLEQRIPIGSCVAVYDLGAGTLDVSVVRREPDGFDVLVVDGMHDFGGLDLDAIIVEQVGETIGATDREAWRRMVTPTDPIGLRAHHALWREAREAKETLSRASSAGLFVPLIERDTLISREEFERDAAADVQRSARLTANLIERASATAGDVVGLFLVGGASRVPLVAATLHRMTGISPVVLEQPEIVVAEGALHAGDGRTRGDEITESAPVPSWIALTSNRRLAAPDTGDVPSSEAPVRRRGGRSVRWIAGAAGLMAAVIVAVLVVAALTRQSHPTSTNNDPRPSPADTGRFTVALTAPCTYLPSTLVGRFVPYPDAPEKVPDAFGAGEAIGCVVRTRTGAPSPQPAILDLEIKRHTGTRKNDGTPITGVQVAREDVAMYEGGRDIPGLGDQAIVRLAEQAEPGPWVDVAFRISNVFVRVRAVYPGAKSPPDQNTIIDMAKTIANELNALIRPPS